MARTIMIGNDVYDKLKKRKGEKSFTEVIKSLMEKDKPKTGKDLMKHFGTIPDDKEWRDLKKKSDRGWKEWTDRYS